VLCSTDVNLETDPSVLLPLVVPLLSSHGGAAVGNDERRMLTQ
jgi:hypothetical protein